MKKLLTLSGILCLSLLASALPAQAQLKIGVVDMDKIFKGYYKTKDAETKINEARASAKKELDDRMDAYNQDLSTIKKMEEEMSNPALSKNSKDEKGKLHDEKIQKLRLTEREIREFQGTREKDLQTQAIRMRNSIVEEIQKLVQDEVKAEGYSLVLDKSGSSLNGVPIILHANNDWDFSQKIIDALNKAKKDEVTAPAPKETGGTKPKKSRSVSLTIGAVAELVGGKIEGGSPDTIITAAAALTEAGEGQITFFGNAKYLPALRVCRATAVLVPQDLDEQIAPVRIRVANPSLAFAQVLERLAPPPVTFAPGVHKTAVIGENVSLGENVNIQPYAVIEPGAKIGAGTFIGAHAYVGHESVLGENCRIYPNVTLRERTRLGNRVIIHSGAVIGGDGFGFEFTGGKHVKIPQIGIVQIDDDVEIGANTTIDRARFGRTWIQEGTKIDNLVQIAHNVVIGKNCIIVSQTGISGSSKLGNYVTLAGQVGVVGHVEIGDQVTIGAKGGVSKNVPSKSIWWGTVAGPIQTEKEKFANIKRLPKLYARVKRLEQILDEKQNSSSEPR